MVTDNRGGYWVLCDDGETWKYIAPSLRNKHGAFRVCAAFNCRQLQHPEDDSTDCGNASGKWLDMRLVGDGRRWTLHRFTLPELRHRIGGRR